MFKRIILIILDSAGIGGAHDASKFNDEGTNTIKHAIEYNNTELPNLKKLGLYNLLYGNNDSPDGYYARVEEESNGKDTLTGHLEMMGVITKQPFKTFMENGFPKELIDDLEQRTGRKVIGNISASGTEIIKDLGEEHMKTGSMIVYTSADSVLQIAAHEEIIPLDELYKICEIARELTLKPEWKVGRIIARPFIGTPGNFTRTANRHDYALDPAHDTVLNYLDNNNYDVISIGKISDIFNHSGINKNIHIEDNTDGISKIIEEEKKKFKGLLFANLNDFDSKYGHRRNPEGYANALKEFDDKLPEIMNHLRFDDLLIITADHGNDPTYTGTDHTRENVPLFVYSKKFQNNGNLGQLKTFSDIGATIADNFKVTSPYGKSFLDKLK